MPLRTGLLLLLLHTRSNFIGILKIFISACGVPAVINPLLTHFKQTRGTYACESHASHFPITRSKQEQFLPTGGIKVPCDGVFEMTGVSIDVCG